jgi:hypothetical protein
LTDARERTCFAVANEILASKALSAPSYAAAEKTMGLESLVMLVAAVGAFSMTCIPHHVSDRSATNDRSRW